jgi:hypothetical protein
MEDASGAWESDVDRIPWFGQVISDHRSARTRPVRQAVADATEIVARCDACTWWSPTLHAFQNIYPVSKGLGLEIYICKATSSEEGVRHRLQWTLIRGALVCPDSYVTRVTSTYLESYCLGSSLSFRVYQPKDLTPTVQRISTMEPVGAPAEPTPKEEPTSFSGPIDVKMAEATQENSAVGLNFLSLAAMLFCHYARLQLACLIFMKHKKEVFLGDKSGFRER